jgi:uncharacterized oxidoreductase
VLVAAGAPAGTAETVAASLVESDLVGHDSHGVRRLVQYLRAVRDGTLDPAARPRLNGVRAATAVVDGRRGFGQLAARNAVGHVRLLARQYGVGTVALSNCNHIGRLGEYVHLLAIDDAVGLAFCNADPSVAPHGGRERRLGTNPFAWAVPRAAGRPPVVADFATSAIAEGKLAMSAADGRRVAPGLLVDSNGRDSTDPDDFYRGGALLPFGQHKGYGLSVLIELVGGLLSGAGVSSLPGYDDTNGTVIVAIDIAAFRPVVDFRRQAEEFCALLSATPPGPDGGRVLIPGEVEAGARATRLRDGIPLSDATWRDLAELPGGPPLP